MAPPPSVDLIGSYPLGTCTKPRVIVDLALTIPAVSRLALCVLILTTLLEALTALQCKTLDSKRHWCLSVIRTSSIQRMS